MANQCSACKLLFRQNPGTCPQCGNTVTVNQMEDQGFLARGYRFAEDAARMQEQFRQHMEEVRSRHSGGTAPQPGIGTRLDQRTATRADIPGFGQTASPREPLAEKRATQAKVPGFGTMETLGRPLRPKTPPSIARRPAKNVRQNGLRVAVSRINWFRVFAVIFILAALWFLRALALSLWENREGILADIINLLTPLITLYIMLMLFKRIIWPSRKNKH